MKVLMLGWEFPPQNSGGLGVACLGLAEALVNQNIEVTFVLPRKVDVEHDLIKLMHVDASKIKLKSVDTALTPYVTSASYAAYRKRIGGDGMYSSTLLDEAMRYAELMKDIVRDEEFDLVHAHDWLSFLAGVEVKRLSGKPLVLHVHITSFDQSGGGDVDPRIFNIEKFGMENADTVVTVSEYTRQIVINKHGIDPNKVKVVHNGFLNVEDSDTNETDSLGILKLKEGGNKIVLFLGRLTMHKGPDYFLHAAKCVLKYEPNTFFVIAGSGDMEWQIISQAAELGISDRVLFTGFVRGNERDCLYRSADLYVLPSVSEPFGLTPLEALLRGDTPVIISKQSGVSEVLKHALKVDFWDTEELTNNIVAVLRHQPLSHSLTENGKREAFDVTWHKAAEKCIAIYSDLINLFKIK